MDNANAASAVSPPSKSSLAQRVMSALLLVPLVLGLVWWSVWAVFGIVAVLIVIGLLELYAAFARCGYRPRTALGVGVALAVLFATAFQRIGALELFPLVLALALLISLSLELLRHPHEQALPAWALTLAGALYIGWLFSHFLLLRSLDTPLRPSPVSALGLTSGAAWVYVVLVSTWLQDTAAYFVGQGWGRRQLAPVLSPKKTWEGAAGGLVGSILGSVACVLLFGLPITIGMGVLLGFVGGVVGPLGDLSESWIKRQVGIKDASQLIPGHGGLLDRVDSLLFTGPVLFYLIRLMLG